MKLNKLLTTMTELDPKCPHCQGSGWINAADGNARECDCIFVGPNEPPKLAPPEMMQSVWITFSDGTKAGFCGKAVAFEGDTRTIKDISFTIPAPLPAGCSFDNLAEL